MILFKVRGRPGQAGPEKAKGWIQVTRSPGTHKPDVASSRQAFGPTAPAVTTTLQRPPGMQGPRVGIGKGMFYVFVGLSKRWAVINCHPALNCTTLSNHDEQVTYEVMSAMEN